MSGGVWQQFLGKLHGLAARLGFTHHLDIRLRHEKRAQPLAHDGMIIRQQYCYFLHIRSFKPFPSPSLILYINDTLPASQQWG